MLEVVTLRREGMRGQAWIIFNDVQAATSALQAEQNFPLFGKDLKLEYAREKSDRIAKRDGSYVPKAKRIKKVVPPPEPASTGAEAQNDAAAAEEQMEADAAQLETEPVERPSHILLANNLPDECNEMMLAMLFRQYAGFKEVRMPRPGLAFVEYEDEPHATLALKGLNGFNLTTSDTLTLNYGKV